MPDIGLLAKVRQELRRRAAEAERRHSFRDRVRELLRDRFGGDRKAFYEAAGLEHIRALLDEFARLKSMGTDSCFMLFMRPFA